MCLHRSVLSGVTSLEDLEAVAAPFKTATKTLAARAAEAGLEAAAMDILGGSKVINLDSLVDLTASLKRSFALFIASFSLAPLVLLPILGSETSMYCM